MVDSTAIVTVAFEAWEVELLTRVIDNLSDAEAKRLKLNKDDLDSLHNIAVEMYQYESLWLDE